jgi:hypothetical protein
MIAWDNDRWIAGVTGSTTGSDGRICNGTTALTAAMQGFVQAKFDDEVLNEIPWRAVPVVQSAIPAGVKVLGQRLAEIEQGP